MKTSAPTPGMPLAMRDTALLVSSLADGAVPDTFAAFREKCDAHVERLRTELLAAHHPQDVIDDALYAQCAALDEAALRSLQQDDRDAWELHPLQVRQFHSHDAGDELIARIERRLAQPQPVQPLLVLFKTVLSLGFKGKFAVLGDDARTALMHAIDARLGHETDAFPATVQIHGAPRNRLTHLSLTGWLVLSGSLSALIYLGMGQWLSLSIARLAH